MTVDVLSAGDASPCDVPGLTYTEVSPSDDDEEEEEARRESLTTLIPEASNAFLCSTDKGHGKSSTLLSRSDFASVGTTLSTMMLCLPDDDLFAFLLLL